MKIGLIADIHANAVALEAVLQDMGKVDAIVCAGDILGYYPYPNETIELLKKNNVQCVMGEHDRAVLTGDMEWFNGVTAVTLRWTARQLTRESIEFIGGLPDHVELNGMTVYHGNPGSMRDFLFEYEPEKMCSIFQSVGQSTFAFGHTHVPLVKDCGDKMVLNPGSVGQPRDGNNQASYAIWDTETRTFELRRVSYDFKRVQAKILAEGLPDLVGERLTYGK